MKRFEHLLLSSLVVTGCDIVGTGVCTESIEPGIVVEIRDARNGMPLAGLARGVVREGAFVDSLRPGESLNPTNVEGSMVSRYAADERSGVYDVEVERAGYQRWTASNIRVRPGECHVQTMTLKADLVPAS